MIGTIGPYKDIDLCNKEAEKLNVLTQQELDKFGLKNEFIFKCEEHLNRPDFKNEPKPEEKPGVLI